LSLYGRRERKWNSRTNIERLDYPLRGRTTSFDRLRLRIRLRSWYSNRFWRRRTRSSSLCRFLHRLQCVCLCVSVWSLVIHLCVTFFRHGFDTQLSHTKRKTLIWGSGSGSREGRSSNFGARGGVFSIEYISTSTKVGGVARITGELTTGT
jgi:hypothetical protein